MKKKHQTGSSSQNNINRFQECCPLKKKEFPTGICSLGLARARWTADHSGYLAFEEKNAPGCLIPGSRVKTKRGFIPIEEIVLGDLVWTHKGRWRPVREIFTRNYEGKIHNFNFNRYFSKDTWFTDEHPILQAFEAKVAGFSWVPAAAIHVDYNSQFTHKTQPKNIFLSAKAGRDSFAYEFRVPDGLSDFVSSDDLLFIAGYYLAEGWTRGKEISFATSNSELPVILDHIRSIWKDGKVFGNTVVRTHYRENGETDIKTGGTISIYSQDLSDWLKMEFGSFCDQKVIPEKYWDLCIRQSDILLEGMYLGDGSKNPDNSFAYGCTNLNLVSWIQHALLKQGRYRPNIQINKKRENRKQAYTIVWNRMNENFWSFEDQEHFMFSPSVKNSKDYSGIVYDLDVEEDHSFDTGFAVHNCPFGMLTEDRHSYCFFKFMADLDRPLTEEEVSRLLCLSKDQIKRIIETASIKLKKTDIMKELEGLYESGHLFEETSEIADDIYFPDQFNPDSVQADGVVEEAVDADLKKR